MSMLFQSLPAMASANIETAKFEGPLSCSFYLLMAPFRSDHIFKFGNNAKIVQYRAIRSDTLAHSNRKPIAQDEIRTDPFDRLYDVAEIGELACKKVDT